jgi:hypothetical protein
LRILLYVSAAAQARYIAGFGSRELSSTQDVYIAIAGRGYSGGVASDVPEFRFDGLQTLSDAYVLMGRRRRVLFNFESKTPILDRNPSSF